MGVTGLQTYMMQSGEAFYKVDIKKLIEEYKKKSGRKEVIIITSGNSIKQMIYGDLNWICRGQYKEFRANVKTFVQTFQAIEGVRLIVYFEGATTDLKRPIWVDRRKKQMKEAIEIYENLRNETFTEHSDKSFNNIPTSLATFMQLTLKLDCNCEVRVAVDECDEEIAEFGRTNNGFAYIGGDTDYVIYNSFEHFISLQEFNLENLTGYKFDSRGLASSLQIPVEQLPIFASLCGNDYINVKNDLQDFHRLALRNYPSRTRKPYRIAVLESVGAYVRGLPRGDALFTALPMVAQRVFGDTSMAADLERSVRSYLPSPPRRSKQVPEIPFPTSEWEETLAKARSAFVCGDIRSIYSIMNKEPYQLNTGLEDYREGTDLPMAPNVYLPLRRRIYGILLKERTGGPGSVEEWVCTGLQSLEHPAYVSVILPPEDLHPGLLALWADGDGEGEYVGPARVEDIVDCRWKLFCHTVSPHLSVDQLRGLVTDGLSHLVIPTLILKYLREAIPQDPSASSPQYLADWELEALAVQAVLLTSTDPSRVAVEMPYDVRAIRIATIFMRGVSQMLMLLASCGFPVPLREGMPWLYFDGKLFHNKYVGLKNNKHVESLCINQDGNSLMQEFLKVKNIALGTA